MHELDFTTGKAAIAYRGDVPWHGYGQSVDSDLSIDQWRVEAGLDWSVKRRPIFCHPTVSQDDESNRQDFNGFNYKRIKNRVALLRSDNQDVLSVVSDRYKVVQPKEVLEFFRDLIEREGFEMHTAGALRDGRRVWALADVGKDFTIKGDKVNGYLLLATAYDGTFATTAQFTSVRVVCNNTLSFSLDAGSDKGMIKIPHNQEFNAPDVKVGLGLDSGWGAFRDNVLQLSEYKVTKREAIEFFLNLLGVTEEEAADGKQLANVKKLLSYYESGPGSDLVTAKDTAWGLVNAVSYWTDHGRRAANRGARFDSASFGTGAKLKKEAVGRALTLAA